MTVLKHLAITTLYEMTRPVQDIQILTHFSGLRTAFGFQPFSQAYARRLDFSLFHRHKTMWVGSAYIPISLYTSICRTFPSFQTRAEILVTRLDFTLSSHRKPKWCFCKDLFHLAFIYLQNATSYRYNSRIYYWDLV